jgi:hypothetical protein
MVIAIESGFVPSLEKSLHQKILKVVVRVRLNPYPTDDFPFSVLG